MIRLWVGWVGVRVGLGGLVGWDRVGWVGVEGGGMGRGRWEVGDR